MARMPVLEITVEVYISFWTALKLRLAGPEFRAAMIDEIILRKTRIHCEDQGLV